MVSARREWPVVQGAWSLATAGWGANARRPALRVSYTQYNLGGRCVIPQLHTYSGTHPGGGFCGRGFGTHTVGVGGAGVDTLGGVGSGAGAGSGSATGTPTPASGCATERPSTGAGLSGAGGAGCATEGVGAVTGATVVVGSLASLPPRTSRCTTRGRPLPPSTARDKPRPAPSATTIATTPMIPRTSRFTLLTLLTTLGAPVRFPSIHATALRRGTSHGAACSGRRSGPAPSGRSPACARPA